MPGPTFTRAECGTPVSPVYSLDPATVFSWTTIDSSTGVITTTPPMDVNLVGLQSLTVIATSGSITTKVDVEANFVCHITDVQVGATSSGLTYVLGSSPLELAIPTAVVTPSACQSLVSFPWVISSS